ncbi:putative RNA-directed DNA polymerase [Helianthus annuus]|nr:putative RNA-directed DNA polymerase [Helianthus annuus]
MTGKSHEEGDWVVDSGATEHMTYRNDLLKNKKKVAYEPPVTIPNGEAIPVDGRGEYTLPGGIKIKGVLHVPEFNCNLLSVGRLTNDLQCSVTFFPDFCVMQGLRTRTLIGEGRYKNGLYRMGMVEGERKAMKTTIDTCHKRLSHASKEKLNKIQSLGNVSFKTLNKNCDSCLRAKHTRSPFPTSISKTNEPFELIHCDIWGPYRTPSFSRANYFLIIVDDYSRAVWVFLIKYKNEASRCLINFHKMVEVHFRKSIKRIRSDNGGEFTSNMMKDFYDKNGILLETSCPHTPQQNGVVERKERHLLEVAHGLRFEASLPKRFWGECVLMAAYIINRLPSTVIENKTPYELILQTTGL